MENNYDQKYQAWLGKKFKAELSFKDQQITFYRRQNEDLRIMLKSQIEQIELYRKMITSEENILMQSTEKSFGININVESTSMSNSSDSSRKIEVSNIGGDFNASGQSLNLGNIDISGQVENIVEQIPDVPRSESEPSLKELLLQLKNIIESSSELSDGEKSLFLEQVKTLAEAKLEIEPEKKERLAKKAQTRIEAFLKILPDTAKIVESIQKLLPMILSAVGLAM